MTIYYSNNNLALDLTKIEYSDFDNENSALTASEQEFDKLLREYINGIKVYIQNNQN